MKAPPVLAGVRGLLYGPPRMPDVLPFRGIRYAASRAATLSRLIAPPYDSVSPAARDELAARSPHNVIHITLGKDQPGDGPTDNKYLRAAQAFERWLADGTLRTDPEPALYPLEQSFTGPDGRPRVRRGLIAACRLHAYEEGIVLPHEKTLTGPKADRLELLKRVKANLSPIFSLYEDDGAEGHRALEAAIAGAGEPVAEADSDDGTHHRLWQVEEPGAVETLRRVLAARKAFIADGHHRYESALAYRDLVEAEAPGLGRDAGHRFIMMTLCSMADPGLVIYPTHRLLTGLAAFELRALPRPARAVLHRRYAHRGPAPPRRPRLGGGAAGRALGQVHCLPHGERRGREGSHPHAARRRRHDRGAAAPEHHAA